jgi:hypothetical protein
MVALTENKAWYDKAFISVSRKGTNTEVQLRAKTTSLNISGGNFDIEGIETFGGKVKRVGSREDMEISFDGIPTSLQDFDWIFHGTDSTASSITSSAISDHRITMLWTDQAVTAATASINSASEAYREIYAGANLISLEKSMDAGEHLTSTMTFKLAFEDDAGSLNWKKEMCDTSSTLSAVPAYSGSTKF